MSGNLQSSSPHDRRIGPSASVEFDPFSDEYFDDPTDVYRRLRDEAPVYFSERYGFYALSRFDDVVGRAPRLEGPLQRPTASTCRRSPRTRTSSGRSG